MTDLLWFVWHGYLVESVAGVTHEPCSRRQVVVLQGGNVIVGHSQLVPGLDEEVVVDAAVLEVMDGSCQVAGHHHEVIHHLLA